MKKFFATQITLILIFAGGLSGMFISTDVYENVQSRIVNVLCLSCLKLEPKTIVEFTFDTANGQSHPEFVIENLTIGPIFLHFSEDVCHGCEVMHPVIEKLFNISFEKTDSVYEIKEIQNTSVVYIYINIDHTTQDLRNSLYIYDKDNVQGLPMFSIITLGYDNGIVKPYYTSIYGTLKDTDQERLDFISSILQEGIEMFKQNIDGFLQP
ncbi:MAG: hypothetical protein JXA91_06395 [Candidatus Thermoplasmatota archaeon]|nr:hypothetical protein [Candidatus Thermoplasmatota archaeon]